MLHSRPPAGNSQGKRKSVLLVGSFRDIDFGRSA